MNAHIDWLTIVGHRDVDDQDWSVNAAYLTAEQHLSDVMPTFNSVVGNPREWEIVKPRAPYSLARRSHDCTRTLYVHPLATHYTLEISGQYCVKIQDRMRALVGAFADNLSRLDLAVDMQTPVMPLEFDQAITSERVITHSVMQSQTGQTVYRGSRSSDRFARVYRYYPPHPRAHLLRAEFQLKHGYAQACAQAFVSGTDLDQLAAGQGEHFGFRHPVWTTRDITPVRIQVPSHPQSGSTVAWLTGTVAPLLRRLEREGKLDLEKWWAEYVTKPE